MLGMVSYSRRPKSGQIMCYLNRTYHVLLTRLAARVDKLVAPCYLISVQRPSYPLALIKGLMADGAWVLRTSALDSALELGFDVEDVYDCIVVHLQDSHFYKTMESEKKKGLMQDVYYITYQDQRLYVKLQVNVQAVVFSFKAAE